jgi:hypothetical protein
MTPSRSSLLVGSLLALGGIAVALIGIAALLVSISIRGSAEVTVTALAQVVTESASTQAALVNTLNAPAPTGQPERVVVVVTATSAPALDTPLATDTPSSPAPTLAPTIAPATATIQSAPVIDTPPIAVDSGVAASVINQEREGPNLLVNGALDGAFVMQCSARGGAPWVAVPCGDPIDYHLTILWQTVQVPVGWVGWWRPPREDPSDPSFYDYPNRCPDGAPIDCVVWHNPEYRDTAAAPQNPPRRLSGDNSLKYFTFYSVHEAGVYQRVYGVQPNQRLRFSIHVQAWSTNDNDAFHSSGQQTMGLRVGIDPYGGDNPWSGNIVWSAPTDAYDQWQLFAVEATAQANAITVFTRSAPVYPLQHNDVYLDEARLVVVEVVQVAVPPGVQ